MSASRSSARRRSGAAAWRSRPTDRAEEHRMPPRELDRALALLATLAALIVVGIVAGILSTGISQEFFQAARTAEQDVARLIGPGAGRGLRLNLALDNLFILVYGSFFVLL